MSELDMNYKVWVENNMPHTVVYWRANDRRDELNRQGERRQLTLEDLSVIYSMCPKFLEEGVLYIKDKKVREYFNLDYSKVIYFKELDKVLDLETEKLEKVIDRVSDTAKEQVANKAKAKGVDSKKKTKIIEEKTGKKITKEEE